MSEIKNAEVGCFCIAGIISLLSYFADIKYGAVMSLIVVIAILIRVFEMPEILKRLFNKEIKK